MKAIIAITTLLFIISCTESETISKGKWKLLKGNVGISAMHMQLLPNNRIIAYDRINAGKSNISLPDGKCFNFSKGLDCTAHCIEFDVLSLRIRPLIFRSDTWCSSGAMTWSGTLVQTGGFQQGERVVRQLPPTDDYKTWTENLNGLVARRWYSTNQILPDGRIIIVGGRDKPSYEFVPKCTRWEHRYAFSLPFLKETRTAYHMENNLYPFVHLSTDGNLFIFANTKSILFDYIRNKVVKRLPEMPGGISRNYPSTGSSVLLPLQLEHGNSTLTKAEVMICGGTNTYSYLNATNGTFLPVSDTCGRLIITDERATWQMERMPVGRIMGDMVMLPTGDVLIVNGAGKGIAGWEMARDPVLTPVLYRTENRSFETMKGSGTPRMYHSTAILGVDGRVVVGGSNTHRVYSFSSVLYPTDLSMEAFYPPYFGRGYRVDIAKIGNFVGYGERFWVRFRVRRGVMKQNLRVVMIAPSFATHSFSMNQRLLSLVVKEVGRVRDGVYDVSVYGPCNAVLAPAGYYMLFVVYDGVPSTAKWVRVGK